MRAIELEHVGGPTLGGKRIRHNAHFDGSFWALGVAVGAHRKRRACQLQNAHEAHQGWGCEWWSWIFPPWPISSYGGPYAPASGSVQLSPQDAHRAAHHFLEHVIFGGARPADLPAVRGGCRDGRRRAQAFRTRCAVVSPARRRSRPRARRPPVTRSPPRSTWPRGRMSATSSPLSSRARRRLFCLKSKGRVSLQSQYLWAMGRILRLAVRAGRRRPDFVGFRIDAHFRQVIVVHHVFLADVTGVLDRFEGASSAFPRADS